MYWYKKVEEESFFGDLKLVKVEAFNDFYHEFLLNHSTP